MSRVSSDEIRDGRVFNGFDYSIQMWVKGGIVTTVGNNPKKYAGLSIYDIPEAEER